MMAKFKVGDRVKHRSSVTGSVADVFPSGNYYVRLDRPAFPGDDCMWNFGESELSPLTPAIPAGWTSASEPPDDIRNVRLLTVNGERDGWYDEVWFAYKPGNNSVLNSDDLAPGEVLAWREIEPDEPQFSEYLTVNGKDEVITGAHERSVIVERSAIDARNEGDYVAIYHKVGSTSPSGVTAVFDQPAAKARYVVCAIPTEHDTLEEAELHALRAMESLRVNVVIARVVEEVKPGSPVITKLEE